MADVIIVLIVIILLGLALKGSIKHFKGEGPCCGGGSGSSRKAKTKFLDVTGDRKKNIKDFRNALRALCEYRNKCIEWIGRYYCKSEFKGQ